MRVGDYVYVEKAGEIIPQVVDVDREARPADAALKLSRPRDAPNAAAPTVRDEGGVFLRCVNPACPAQIKERLRYFCGRNQMDIEGMGYALVEQLVEMGWVKSFGDLYRLKDRREELAELVFAASEKAPPRRLGGKSAAKLLAAIEAEQAAPALASARRLGHPARRGQHRAAPGRSFRLDASDSKSPARHELEEISGIGPELAQSVYTFLHSPQGEALINDLRAAGLTLTQTRRDAGVALPLAGKTIVVTGTLETFSRKEIQDLIAALGGACRRFGLEEHRLPRRRR